MKPDTSNAGRVGITLRTALLSWLVTLATMLIFVSVIIPLQQRTFREHLQSKAHGVAISLGDVAAGAVVSEDYSSVVDYCQKVLKDDPVVEYLVLAKNDGYSLINDLKGWRVETNLAKEWRPDRRVASHSMGRVPFATQPMFHYSQPLDYTGIEWGWLHVGLSLSGYDRSVAMMYERTGLLAVVCILLSLLASVVYAKRLVRPILTLRQVVQEVAAGDLSVRAAIDRRDELGSLALSVNSMTEALLRRDRILQSVRFAAREFLSVFNWREVIADVLARVGDAAGADRIRVFENRRQGDDVIQAECRYSWLAPGVRDTLREPPLSELVFASTDFPLWHQELSQGRMVQARPRELPEDQRRRLEPGGVQALLAIPIVVEGFWWGLLTLVDSRSERDWSEAERDSIRAVADMLGATIARQRAQDALAEAKATLELRVAERTRELREQVAEKERAHAELAEEVAARQKAHAALAEAQHRLMEASRQAGMAEVATGVLHNVGNVLNSVNVSTTLVFDRIRQSKVSSLTKAAQLLRERETDLASYLTTDPRGQRLPSLLCQLSEHLGREREAVLVELRALVNNVEHIKEIVAMQQSYAKVAGVLETISLAEIVENALTMNAAALRRHCVELVREFEPIPQGTFDKHKVLQILVNLIRNAKYALDDKPGAYAKRLRVCLERVADDRVRIAVIDNGVGIAAENLTRIFAHGFTTRKGGHGFGLHMGALAAKEMGGALQAFSDGLGQGATFVLELPFLPPRIPARV